MLWGEGRNLAQLVLALNSKCFPVKLLISSSPALGSHQPECLCAHLLWNCQQGWNKHITCLLYPTFLKHFLSWIHTLLSSFSSYIYFSIRFLKKYLHFSDHRFWGKTRVSAKKLNSSKNCKFKKYACLPKFLFFSFKISKAFFPDWCYSKWQTSSADVI